MVGNDVFVVRWQAGVISRFTTALILLSLSPDQWAEILGLSWGERLLSSKAVIHLTPCERLLAANRRHSLTTKKPTTWAGFSTSGEVGQTARLRLANPIATRPRPNRASVPGSGTDTGVDTWVTALSRIASQPPSFDPIGAALNQSQPR